MAKYKVKSNNNYTLRNLWQKSSRIFDSRGAGLEENTQMSFPWWQHSNIFIVSDMQKEDLRLIWKRSSCSVFSHSLLYPFYKSTYLLSSPFLLFLSNSFFLFSKITLEILSFHSYTVKPFQNVAPCVFEVLHLLPVLNSPLPGYPIFQVLCSKIALFALCWSCRVH